MRKSNLRVFGSSVVLLVIISLLTPACGNTKLTGSPESQNVLDRNTNQIIAKFNELSNIKIPDLSQVNSLLMNYTGRYLTTNGEPMEELEGFLLEHCGRRAAGYAAVSLVRSGRSVPFTADLLEIAEPSNNEEAAMFHHAGLIYETSNLGLSEYLDDDEARRIVQLMEEARRLRPTYLYNDRLADAYEKLGLSRSRFELGMELFYDEGSEGLDSKRELRTMLRKLPGENSSFDDELTRAGVRVNEMMDNWSSIVTDYQLSRELFLTTDGDIDIYLDFEDESSPVYQRPLAMAVFTTSCGYCIEELKTLSRFYGKYELDIAIMGLRKPEQGTANQTKSLTNWARKHRISIPLLENADSTILSQLDVGTVPVLFLFDHEGKLTKKVRFQNQSNLTMKLSWYLDELANATR